ncbi:hypothetical protein [Mucisphaera calidilacus]|uniref:Tellurite resistance protein TerB n=1 Tax=Mucisphaera calidilacus TaxID=2527982 RepID=A0A518BVA1_9BACT|nr:hypothetical protein [Mucisphaera calidilacus]QDU70899.1 hypothetical protein Pan265_07410 [Mucisphaera calidilacus]
MWEDFFANYYDVVDGWEQGQREALVDAMVWTMYADRHLSDDERGSIESQAKEVEWNSRVPIADYVLQSVSRLRQVLGDEAKEEAYLKDIVDRLATEPACRQAVESCRAVALSDCDEDAREHVFLSRLEGAIKGEG